MPELPEVETVRRGIENALEGLRIKSVTLRREGLRTPFPKNLRKKMEGKSLERIDRLSKYILMVLKGEEILVLHLGMSGRVIIVSPQENYDLQKHDHMVLDFTNGFRMILNDARRFGAVLFFKDELELRAHPSFKYIGPEPLSNDFSAPVLETALKSKARTIKAALMDQRIVAGLGNIYVSEALFQSGINPEKKAGEITSREIEKLVRAIRDVLQRAILAGGSTLRDYRKADGDLGYFQHQFAVYGKEGEPCLGCACDVNKTGGVRRIVQSGRSTFYCPKRQK